MTTLEETLEYVQNRTRRMFAGAPNLEDLVQEAAISAWKDYEDGKERQHIWVRAKYRVKGLLRADLPPKEDRSGAHPQQWTGHLLAGRDHQNPKAGEAMREKIRQYLTEYRSLHGHQPTHAEIAKAVGVSSPTVTSHMKKLYLFAGPSMKSLTSMDTLLGFDPAGVDQVEETVDTQLDFVRLLNRLPNEQERKCLYLHLCEDKTYGDIGKEINLTEHRVGQIVRNALVTLKGVMER